jgi:hypothetical protein
MRISVIAEILKNVPLPRLVRVKQIFPAAEIQDVAGELRRQIRQPEYSDRIKRNMKVAIAVGSRGVAELPLIVRTVVEEIKRVEALPFIVPAMGSHGGATAAGQISVLANLGVTEASAGCPIVSSMEVVELGHIANGLPVLMDKDAYAADGIVVINRIKAHNAFSGPVESGLSKMITIGLGKQKGADACHTYGFAQMSANIVAMTQIKLVKANFLFGVGTVENAYDKVSKIVVVRPEDIIDADNKLLIEAKANMPHILFDHIDVLIVDQIGKEFSGGGMDSHTVGRASTNCVAPEAMPPVRLVVLDVSDSSHGNACGMGLADVTTRRLFDKINFDITYPNIITSTAVNSGRIPLIMESDRLAIQCAVKTCNAPDQNKLRMVRIPNSLRLGEIDIAETMLSEVMGREEILPLTEPREFDFDVADNLRDLGFKN